MHLIDAFPNVKGSKTMAPAWKRCQAVASWKLLTAVVYHPARGFFPAAILTPATMYLARDLVERGFVVTDGHYCEASEPPQRLEDHDVPVE